MHTYKKKDFIQWDYEQLVADLTQPPTSKTYLSHNRSSEMSDFWQAEIYNLSVPFQIDFKRKKTFWQHIYDKDEYN